MKRSGFRRLLIVLLILAVIIAPAAVIPAVTFAEDSDGTESEAGADIREIWVVPEVISGARQPAKDGMFAWVTFDYFYGGDGLQNELDAGDFMLQRKLHGGEWTDVPGNNVLIAGGDEYYIASFEAIIAANIPDNNDPFIKKWRVVYKPDDPSKRIESEVIVQAANLPEDRNVTVFDRTDCFDYTVQQVPWSKEQYDIDHIPPVYIAHVYPDALAGIKDNGLIAADDHRIVLPWMHGIWMGSEPWEMTDKGIGFGHDDFSNMNTGLYFGEDAYSDEASGSDQASGIASLTGYWNSLAEDGMWPGAGPVPDAEALYDKLASTVCVPDENADEYLSYVVEGSSVFWVSGAGTQERIDQNVSDYILVVVLDWEAAGGVQHEWSEPEWSWTGSDEDGYTAATATFTCSVNENHKRTVRAVIRCITEGDDNVYTAIAAFDDEEYTDTKTVHIEEEPEPAPALKPAPVTINKSTVTAAVVKQAVNNAAAKGKRPSQFILGKSVKKIGESAFKGTNVKSLVVKSKKLTRSSVKGSLTGSKITTVKVKLGSTKLNKTYVKKYKPFFTKKNAGKKATVK